MRFRSFLFVFVLVSSALAVGASAIHILSNAPQNTIPDTPDQSNESVKTRLVSFFGQKNPGQFEHRIDGIGEPPPNVESLLTGLPKKNTGDERFFGVMIDEAPSARANFRGLEQAKLIFEMPAEGGVPRILAIFSDQEYPAEIGPVRSARHYFVQVAEPLMSGYVHAGGSPQAFSLLAKTEMANFNESSETMRRDYNLARPHNLFLVTEKIIADLVSSPVTEPVFSFSNEFPEDAPSATHIDVDFSTLNHEVVWNYTPEKKCYERQQKFETNAICIENILVLTTDVWPIANDPKNRLDITTVGEGAATLFRDGKAIEAKWRREEGKVFSFFDGSNIELELRPGKTMIQVLDSPEKMKFSVPQ